MTMITTITKMIMIAEVRTVIKVIYMMNMIVKSAEISYSSNV